MKIGMKNFNIALQCYEDVNDMFKNNDNEIL